VRAVLVNLDGCLLPWALRLREEGHEVVLVNVRGDSLRVGEGIVETRKLIDVLREPEGYIWIWDFVNPEHGAIADWLRSRGIKVFGAGLWNAVLEEERGEAEEFAKSVGLNVPRTLYFESPSDALEYVREEGGRWVWKPEGWSPTWATYVARDEEDMVTFLRDLAPSGPGILQRYVEGVALSTTFWFDGDRILRPIIGMVEDKRFQPGVNIGSAISWVWAYEDDDHIWDALNLEAVEDALGYFGMPPGEYDINCQYDGERFWFLEWGPRLGWDEDVTYLPAWEELGNSVERLVNGELDLLPVSSGLHLGVRVTIPPYPHADEAKEVPYWFPKHAWDEPGFYPYDARLEGNRYWTASPVGVVGVAVDSDPATVVIPQAQYRTDWDDFLARAKQYVPWIPDKPSLIKSLNR
jgi:hypothetical protein